MIPELVFTISGIPILTRKHGSRGVALICSTKELSGNVVDELHCVVPASTGKAMPRRMPAGDC